MAVANNATTHPTNARRLTVRGGNIDTPLLMQVIRFGLTNQGRYLVIRTRLIDRPGQLMELLKLIAEEPMISILVLGASTNPKGPGPLVSALTGKFVSRLRIPVTIVPGNLSDEDIESLA